MTIYRAKMVQEIQDFYGELLFPKEHETIYRHLLRISECLHEGLQQQVNCLYTQLNNYNPDFIGIPTSKLKERAFDHADCQYTIAREFGFNSWVDVQGLQTVKYNIEFEKCVNYVVHGEIDKVKAILEVNPEIIHQQSQYGHRASLLHYIGSNGVEFWRQQVPLNLSEVGLFTAYQLYQSSAHPINAGLNKSTLELLEIDPE